jgi:5-methyltetrahydrofolate--homocysteine methyltransferase
MSTAIEQIADNLIRGNISRVVELVKKALDEGYEAQKILTDGLMPGMTVVGDRFKRDEMYLAEVLVCARAMKEASEVLTPILSKSTVKQAGKVILGTVKGDLHDIGKNIVGTMLEGAGFGVVDLGTNVSPEGFIEAAKQEGVDIIGLSAMLTTTMIEMKNVIATLKESGLSGKVKVILGGAPITQEFTDEIGADGFAEDAGYAVDKVRELMKA